MCFKDLLSSCFYRLFGCIFLLLFIAGCNSGFTPKPRGYFAIDFPKHDYQSFSQPGYPYEFEYPVYAKVIKDTTFFESKPENDWWINIDFPQFNGKVYISYKSLASNDFSKMVNDAYNLTFKHSYKASSIDDSAINTPNQVHGVMFKVGGNAATATQFYLSDSVKHFLRGALYFDAAPNEDSLKPVNAFLLEDLQHMVNTFKWKQ